MLKMKKKNGFTLVELLAVIVILAVVMLIGVTVIGPIMARSQKGALGTEGIDMINAAQNAYQAEQLKGTGAAFKNNSTVCFDLEWLKANGYFTKGSAEGYTGSVLVHYKDGNYTYKFWVTNGTYTYKEIEKNKYSLDDSSDFNSSTDTDNIMKTCNNANTLDDGATKVVKCTYSSGTSNCA